MLVIAFARMFKAFSDYIIHDLRFIIHMIANLMLLGFTPTGKLP